MSTSLNELKDRFHFVLTFKPDLVKMKEDLKLIYELSLKDFSQAKRYKELSSSIRTWEDNIEKINIALELYPISSDSEKEEILLNLEKYIEQLNQEMIISKFNQPYDSNPVLLEITAGTGGVDAMDWALILSNMYKQFCREYGYSLEIIDQNYGEEAGIKSASMIIDFQWAYGWMKHESGTHRLVRISPFNANNKRQTSFALVQVLPYINNPQLDFNHDEIRIDVFRSSGKGGQGVNTTDSAVRIVHIPTQTIVTIQSERSQLKNKERALKILKSKLLSMHNNAHNDKMSSLKTNHSAASWGEQIRNYVEAPYKLVKDTHSGWQTSDIDGFYKGKYLFNNWTHSIANEK